MKSIFKIISRFRLVIGTCGKYDFHILPLENDQQSNLEILVILYFSIILCVIYLSYNSSTQFQYELNEFILFLLYNIIYLITAING
jgi:hypothetical protein